MNQCYLHAEEEGIIQDHVDVVSWTGGQEEEENLTQDLHV